MNDSDKNILEEARDGPPRFVVRDVAYALQPRPPLEYVVKPLFVSPSVNMFFSEPGHLKTWSMIDLGVCLATGADKWLDFEIPEKKLRPLIGGESPCKTNGERILVQVVGHFQHQGWIIRHPGGCIGQPLLDIIDQRLPLLGFQVPDFIVPGQLDPVPHNTIVLSQVKILTEYLFIQFFPF